jgi:hypothetical protein
MAEGRRMVDLHFAVDSAAPLRHAAAPHLVFRLRLWQAEAPPVAVHNIALRCQIRIEPTRRRYGPEEQARLRDLFGEPERWGQTLRSMLWTHANVNVPPFTGETTVELPVPCTYDFNVAATKYFYGLEEGDVPLSLLFSGTIFFAADNGALRVTQIPWEKEAQYRLPVSCWKQMMELYYPNSAWLCLRRDVFDRLDDYKRQHSLPTWEQALESLLVSPSPQEQR